MESGIFAVGLTCLALGGALTLLGWNVIRRDRRREAASTALLAHLAFPEGMPAEPIEVLLEAPITEATGRFGVDEFLGESSTTAKPRGPRTAGPSEPLFRDHHASGAASRRAAALAAVGVGFAIVTGAYWWFASADSRSAAATTSAPAADAVASATTMPLPVPVQTASRVELLSLTHRATPAAFVVTGRVHNPAEAAPLRDVVVVVEVMDRAGRVLMTVRAPLSRRNLNAGDDAEFSAAALKATNVGQYRVTFQDTTSVVIPHVDRRQKAVNSHV